MTAVEVRAALPLLVLAATPVLVMLAIAIRRSHRLAFGLSGAGLLATLVLLVATGVTGPGRAVGPLLLMDGFAVFGMALLVLGALAVTVLSYEYLAGYPGWREEYYVLVLVATLGAAVLAASNHFASLFLGLETLSVSLYAIIAFFPGKQGSLEAGIKYLVLAASTSAFLLFGMALIYAGTGSLRLDALARSATAAADPRVLLVAGSALVLVGIGFKLALVPFHMWTPDIYQGAPAPVSAFVATVSKGALVLVLLRFVRAAGENASAAGELLAGLAVASMLIGNLLALQQRNLKRLLAYSSIAHLGYLLVAFQAQGPAAASAASFYLVAYFVTMLGAFAVLIILSSPGREAELVDDYRGLFWRRPLLAGSFTLMLLSLAGIPLTAGFMGKVWVLSAGTSVAAWVPVLVLVVGSSIGLYYYLRVVAIMYQTEAGGQSADPETRGLAARIVLGCLTTLLLWFGVYPDAILGVVHGAMRTLGQ